MARHYIMSELAFCAFHRFDKVANRLLIRPGRTFTIRFRQDSVRDQRIEQRFRDPAL